jgi:hypothetical protein
MRYRCDRLLLSKASYGSVCERAKHLLGHLQRPVRSAILATLPVISGCQRPCSDLPTGSPVLLAGERTAARDAANQNGRRMAGRAACSAAANRWSRLIALLGTLAALLTLVGGLVGCGETLSAPFATPTAPAPTATSSVPRTPAPKIAARSAFHWSLPLYSIAADDKCALDQVRRARTRRIAARGVEPATMASCHADHAHEAGHTLAPTPHALRGKFGMNARRAIGPATHGVNRGDLLPQRVVRLCASRGLSRAPHPVATRGDTEYTAETCHRMYGL